MNKTAKKSSQAVAYKGKVNIEVRKGKKTIAKSSYHNDGTIQLFTFLGYCIKGSYNDVEILRPKFIKLFTVGSSGDPNPIYDSQYNTFNELVSKDTTKLLSLNYPVYSGDPRFSTTIDPDTASVTFKYVVPFSQINLSGGDINMIALYSQLNKSSDENASMFVIITSENDDHYLSSLLDEMGIDLSTNINEYNLLIEWTTTFKNEEGE